MIRNNKSAQQQQQRSSSEQEDALKIEQKNIVQNPSISTKINKNFYDRAKAGITMFVGFIIILLTGQTYIVLLILILQIMIFKEFKQVQDHRFSQINTPTTNKLAWILFWIFQYERISFLFTNKFSHLLYQYPWLQFSLANYKMLTYVLILIVLVYFVINLELQTMKKQFQMLFWNLMNCFISVYVGNYAINNTIEGQLWFTLPALLIAINDIFAYLFGYFFGKHQLIMISPKKTWEGYLGSSVPTFILALFLSGVFQKIPGLTCKLQKPTLIPFHFDSCQGKLLEKVFIFNYQCSIFTVHMLIISIFISFIGPFGGFFASGLKRYLKIKNFSNMIPGHGGLLDRIDCKILTSFFIYYYIQFNLKMDHTVPGTWIKSLTFEQQLILFKQLQLNL